MAAGRGIEAYQSDQGSVKSLQGYHMDIDPPLEDHGGNNQ